MNLLATVPDPGILDDRTTEARAHRQRTKFTPEQDEQIAILADQGTAWQCIALQIPGKSARQCRERYLHYLRPAIYKGGWTADEDAMLDKLHQELGNSWAEIARFLPGRTNIGTKNRWNAHFKRATNQTAQTNGDVVSEFESSNEPDLDLDGEFHDLYPFHD
jgi:hypothetical protein